MNEYGPNFNQEMTETKEPLVQAAMPVQEEETSKKKTKHRKIKKQHREKNVKQPRLEKEYKGSVLLYALGSIILPYLFILLMGLLDQMNILRANVMVIIGISIVLFVVMIIMAIRCGRTRKKNVTA